MSLIDALQAVLGEDFDVTGELGGGGMSRVFVAHDRKLDRKVVVKVLSSDLAADVSIDRFKREILVAAGLQHPNIVSVISAGEADGLPFFIMPFVEGESLRKRIAREGALSITDTVFILRDVARALAYAHEKGIVHRDVKPDNILLTSGAATLADFGVAKALDQARHGTDAALTGVGASLGTPNYMAPEQAAADDDVDHRADIYALGITAYEMLTGAPPFADLPPAKVLAAHIAQPPPPIRSARNDLPDALATFVESALAKDPADRPQSADQVATLLDAALSGARVTPVTAPIRASVRRGRRRFALFASVGIGAVVIGSFVINGLRASDTEAEPEPEAGSIAVLPFENVGGDQSNEYFADGMTDELITALNHIPDLRVSSRTAVYAFKRSSLSVGKLADSLRVRMLLEGTVRRGGSRLRVTARLVDASNGQAIWSQTYEREIEDVFTVQDELTESIVGALEQRLSSQLAHSDEHRGTDDLAAYDLYLRGRYFFRQRGEDAIRTALGYFRDAVTEDTGYADAYAGIADALSLLPLYSETPSDSVLPLALQAADRAVTLDSSLAVGFAARANLLNAQWRWAEADHDYQRAIALDPRYATARQWYGEHLLVTGRLDGAIVQLGTAAELDPVSPVIHGSYGGALGVAGLHDSSVTTARRGVELDPELAVTRMMLGACLLYGGDMREAIPELELARAGAQVPAIEGLLGYAYARIGAPGRARGILDALDTTDLNTGNAMAIARVHLGLGERDLALEWMLRAAEHHDPFFASESLASPIFDEVRGDPRFAQVLDRVGLSRERFAAR